MSLLAVWQGWLSLEFATYRTLRNFFGAFIVAFAILAVYRVASAVYHGDAKQDFFRPELIGYTVFWVLFPPVWFFLEYYAIDLGAVRLLAGTCLKATLQSVKDYADFASKVWTAVLACLAGLLGLVAK